MLVRALEVARRGSNPLLLHRLCPAEMSDDPIVYSTDPAKQREIDLRVRTSAIKLAIEQGKSIDEIITRFTRGMSHAEVRESAENYASLLGLTRTEFMRIARPRS